MFWNKKQQQTAQPTATQQWEEIRRSEERRSAKEQQLIQLGENVVERLMSTFSLGPNKTYYDHSEDIVLSGITFEVSAHVNYFSSWSLSMKPVTAGAFGRSSSDVVLIALCGGERHAWIHPEMVPTVPEGMLLAAISDIGTWR